MGECHKTVVITGGSSGIGRETALHFAERGWNVGLIARGEDNLNSVAAQIVRTGGKAAIAAADVADAPALERAAARLEEELGDIDVWINGAGVAFYAPFPDITDEEFQRVTEVTYLGTVHGTRAALKRMRPRGQGTIVNIGSVIAYRAAPLQSAYSGAKYAVRGFTEAVRSELLREGSRVHLTMVHPPSVNTPFFSHAGARMGEAEPRPLPPVYQPGVIADAIYFAATHRRREIRATAASAQLAALNQLAPALMDRVLSWIGFGGQQTQRDPVRARRDPALFEPGKRPSMAHGPFDNESFDHSLQVWATKNRGSLALGFGLLGFGLFLLKNRCTHNRA